MQPEAVDIEINATEDVATTSSPLTMLGLGSDSARKVYSKTGNAPGVSLDSDADGHVVRNRR